MDPIRDSDLILYHYRDGLDADRWAAIDRALVESPALAARYARLCQTLALADAAPVPEPDAGFERRLWTALEQRIGPAPARPGIAQWLRRWWEAPLRPAFAAAAGVVLALGVAFYAGRYSAPLPAASPVAATEKGAAMGDKVLEAYIAAHLRTTQNVVLTAVNVQSPELLAGNRDIAEDLIESNRLYAAAAQRAGNARLAEFLRRLEPLLMELANQNGAGGIQDSNGLREYVEKNDLLFELKATQARIEPRRSTSI
ncbi:hypothetical protein [Tahibacter amnicola]|uniref:Anti-sigma factor n=1 Tax=Tahibacter amnicola TaxID=2976241 RepID=A0ABY6BH19_9GAMM|nr:hypothetical protein [Tahibacter amnicola]UXI68881.1 hypothetical protein N4264_04285 [Tahibacter amnicola]